MCTVAITTTQMHGTLHEQSSLERNRNKDKNNKRQTRNATGEALKILDRLLPPSRNIRPRTLHETLVAAAHFVSCPIAAPELRQGMLSQANCGWILIDADLTILDANPFLATLLGTSALPRGSKLPPLLDPAAAEELAIVAQHLARGHFRDPQQRRFMLAVLPAA